MDSPPTADVTLSGRLSLRLNGGTSSDDNKTLDGDYTIVFTKNNIAGGNGDTYRMRASFKPDNNWYEAMVGDYVGTVNVTVEY
ncbi:hypothetical protein [Deinococcus arcticus]|nr:hypothetical protein [Deinococcus arcticus]